MSQTKRAAQPFELLLDQKAIQKRVAELGREITADYRGKDLVIVGVLKGCVVFLADLIRQIELTLEVEFVSAASYRQGRKQAETLDLGHGLDVSVAGRDVLLVEAVVDSARTVTTVQKRLKEQKPASIEIVTLIDKPGSHRTRVDLKYKGFTVGNEFVIGYGLDNTQKYRNLAFVGRMIDR